MVLLLEALKKGLSLKSKHLARLGIRVPEVTRKLYELGAGGDLALPSLEVVSGNSSCNACSFTF